ncbi:MAG: stage III sporulation protein AF [Clostridiales bacterium]|nr:stage III sporulation protein AF [Clostridiales bacterium]
MENVYDYIRNIGCFAVFAAAVKMISPEGSFRGYINMILGLMLMGIMLNPISVVLKTTLPELQDYVLKEGSAVLSEAFDEEEYRETVISEYESLVRERVLKLCQSYIENPSVSAEIGSDFSVGKIYIKGKQTGDSEGLKSLIAEIFGCEEENIIITEDE